MTAPIRTIALFTTLALGFAVAFVSSAGAATGPAFHLYSRANTTVKPGDTFTYFLAVVNGGDEPASGPVTLSGTLPPGITILSSSFSAFECPTLIPGAQTFSCETAGNFDPHTSNRSSGLGITVQVDPDAHGVLGADFELSGTGVSATTVDPTTISAAEPVGGIDAFDQQVSDASGNPETRAAAHPYEVSTEIDFNTADLPNASNGGAGEDWPIEPAKDALVDLPPGLIGNPNAVPVRCTAAQLTFGGFAQERLCPAASQVGTISLFFHQGLLGGDPAPLFSMVPPTGGAARFGFNASGTLVVLDASLRPGGDYGLTIASRGISETLALAGTRINFWGVPADPSHDFERACPGSERELASGGPVATDPACAAIAEELGLPNPPYTRPPLEAFLRNPTSCTAPGEGLTTILHTDSWFNPGAVNPDGSPDLSDPAWKSASTTSHEAPGYPYPPSEWGPTVGIDHCEEVPFEPTIAVQPTTEEADSPTGLEVDLSVPQEALTDPDAIAQSDLKGAVVKLPEGMSVNPAQANGLGGCSAAQIDLHGENTQPSCPNSSKIGTVSIKTPLLDHPIDGGVYLASQGDNPFHSLLALYLVADDKVQTGTVIKLAGKVNLNPVTGQLETVFVNQPQLPFENLHLELFGGAHAALITPPHCGIYTTHSELAPWSGNAASELSSSFTLTSGPSGTPCPPKPAAFAPKLSAGTAIPTAGAFSPFSLRLTREDGTQRFAALNATLPPGLVGKLAGIPYCPEAALAGISAATGTGAAQLASPSCPAASQVGSVTVGAGSGPDPFFVQTGKAYLAGPYKGAPLSLVVVTPALAGPFDLGTVVVRNALRVDPASAQITAVSDPLPQIVHGIPLDLRDLRVNISRPQFTLNPTSCDPMAIEGTVAGSEGANANVSARFQVGDCARLGFKPRLRIKLKGPTGRSGHPALRAELRARPGDANIAATSVALPHSEFLAQSHIRTICTRVQFAAAPGNGAGCPKGSIYGHARAITPLLDRPLEGPVYLRSSNHPLPDLVAALGGQIEVELVGRIDTDRAGGIRTTFATVPDAPVSKFVLTMPAGKKSLLENSRNLCRSSARATVRIDAQSGKASDRRPLVRNSCAEQRSPHKKKKGKR